MHNAAVFSLVQRPPQIWIHLDNEIKVLESFLYCWSINLSESIYFDMLCKIIRAWIHAFLDHSENKLLHMC